MVEPVGLRLEVARSDTGSVAGWDFGFYCTKTVLCFGTWACSICNFEVMITGANHYTRAVVQTSSCLIMLVFASQPN